MSCPDLLSFGDVRHSDHRQKQVRIMLRKWEESMTQKNVVNQHVFNEEIKKVGIGRYPLYCT